MILESVSGAAAIALVSTLIFALCARSMQVLGQSFGRSSRFPRSILYESAQRFRDELDGLSRHQALYLASSAVFAVIFLTVYLLRPARMFDGRPGWQLVAMLAVIAAICFYFAYRAFTVVLARRRLAFVRDANIAIGHSLQKLSANQNRVFHDVTCAAGVIDHVIVGLHGMYAIDVLARRPGRDNRVRLTGDRLAFAPGKTILSVCETGRKADRLARECRKHIGHDIRVRPVIAVPGWEVDAQASDDYLVVNEQNFAMLRGWKDQQDYLMNEDVKIVQDLLTERCTRFAKK